MAQYRAGAALRADFAPRGAAAWFVSAARYPDREEDGVWRMRPEPPGDVVELLQQFGTMPLPPYMHRKVANDNDWQRYQTTYASHPGSVAAPTAGLHLTESLLAKIQERGIDIARVTLHIGLGTFRPISTTTLCGHVMHSEWCSVPLTAAQQLKSTRAAAGRIVAVGTTSVRTLESMPEPYHRAVQPWQGRTDIFIRPGHQLRAFRSGLIRCG